VGAKIPAVGWGLVEADERGLEGFVRKTVTGDTMKKYGYGWRDWCLYGEDLGWSDFYMTTATRTEKIRHMMNFFKKRYDKGLREKQATGAGAAVRKYFQIQLMSTEWFGDPQVSEARKSCRRSAAENREYVRSGAGKDKKPIWYDLLTQMRDTLWVRKDYSYGQIDGKMISINAMFSYDLAIRKGEANLAAKKSEDHTIRTEDVTFQLYAPVEIGGQLVHAIRGGSSRFRRYVDVDNVEECCVMGVTHKVGLIRAGKRIQRRTAEEEELLEDLVEWVMYSGSGPEDPLFSRYTQFPGAKDEEDVHR
jgi:hypothetical protein